MGKRTLHRPRRRSSGEFKAAFYLTTSPPISATCLLVVGCCSSDGESCEKALTADAFPPLRPE